MNEEHWEEFKINGKWEEGGGIKQYGLPASK